MGIDLDDADIESEDDLVDRVYEHMKNEEARRRERSAERRKSAGQQRAEASAQAAKQFLREIYRKLASAVHWIARRMLRDAPKRPSSCNRSTTRTRRTIC